MPDAPHPRHDIALLLAACPGVPFEQDPALVRQKSRDFFWFSPILNRVFRHKTAEVVARPRSEADVIAIAAACARFRIPITLRGAGTGTYGQGVPEQGGVLLDMTGMNQVLWADERGARAQAGARMMAVEDAALAGGRELRMHPSTKRMSTIGGYFCGGSGGIGSNLWGGLREPGNMQGARVVTVETHPRVLELRGQDCNLVNRTYGSTGIVVEVEVPLAPTRPWRDVILAFDTFPAALQAAHDLATGPIPAKLVCLLEDTAAIGLPPVFGEDAAPPGKHLVLSMVDAADEAALRAFAAEAGGTVTLFADSRAREADPDAVPVYEGAWGHTTLHARKIDRDLTYLQTLHPPGRIIQAATWSWQHYGGQEMPMHLEFIRYEGEPAANGAHLLRLPADDAGARARLAEIIEAHEAAGIPVANPHVATVEDGSRHKRVPGDQLGFKALVDPHGLLNPGKMPSYVPAIP